ncbi:lipopolysaccharide core heptose(II) kinase RfaY [Klebsiella aerogenes]
MIEKLMHGEWTCHSRGADFFDTFRDILALKFKVLRKFKTNNHTKVALIETSAGIFVIKIYAPRKKRGEKFFKTFFFGSYQENLIHQIDRAKSMGDDFVNDFYFLAEKRLFGFPLVSVMLFEYIPGTSLDDLPTTPPSLIRTVMASVEKMHGMGIISGDPHKGNFIMSPAGIKVIDLSGKRCSALRKAQDNIMLEKHFSATVTRDFWYDIVSIRDIQRNILRKYKMKLSLLLYKYNNN